VDYLVKDMIKKCSTELAVNKDFALWHNNKKGKLVLKKLWYRGSGTFYLQIDIKTKALNLTDSFCYVGFYANKEGVYLVFDDESSIRIDYSKELIDYLCSFQDNVNYELRRYRG
jgi:ABC-type tungstate transport system permease subunit